MASSGVAVGLNRDSHEEPAGIGATWVSPRIAAGGTLGASVFLVEAGVAELVLRGDRICQELKAANWAFNPGGCQPESLTWLLRGLSRGIVGALRPELSPLIGAATMAVGIGLVAALLGLLPLRKAVPLFLGVQLLLAGAFAFIGYLVSYLA